jgi:hypothetical protein
MRILTRISGSLRPVAWFALLSAGAFWPPRAGAQESESVWISNVTGSAVGENLSPEEGRQKAKAQAYAQALQKLGINFSVDYLLRQSEADQSPEKLRRANDAFLLLLRARGQGFVTGTRNATWEVRSSSKGTEYRVTLDAKITRPRGAADHGFYVKLSTNTPMVRPGENIHCQLSPSRQSFLYVFHVTRDGVLQLYPDSPGGDIAMADGGTLEIPSSAGLPWEAALPEGWETSEELLLAIASKVRFDPEGRGVVDREGYRSAREAALIELLEWLAGLPAGEAAEASLRIDVVRN